MAMTNLRQTIHEMGIYTTGLQLFSHLLLISLKYQQYHGDSFLTFVVRELPTVDY